MPYITVIIATSARPIALAETLRSLAQVRLPEVLPVEVIVVENGNPSGAKKAVPILDGCGFRRVQYLFEPSRGKSRALNLALAHVTGDILLFSDDDVRFPRDWIRDMCAPIAAGRADAVAGGVRLAPHLVRPWMTKIHRAWLASTADYLSSEDPAELCGANMAIHRQAVEAVNGFDSNLGPGVTGGGEESLLSWRIRAAGCKVIAALDVEVEHHFAEDRLCYAKWLEAARLRGEAHAYHLHHWFHRSLPFAQIRTHWLKAKLVARRFLTRRHEAHEEGIAPWELSYVEEMAMCARWKSEKNTPRNYPAASEAIRAPQIFGIA